MYQKDHILQVYYPISSDVAADETATDTEGADVNSAVRIAQRVTSSTNTTGTVIQIIITRIRITKQRVAGDVTGYGILTGDTAYPIAAFVAVDIAAGKCRVAASVRAKNGLALNTESNNAVFQSWIGIILAINPAAPGAG